MPRFGEHVQASRFLQQSGGLVGTALVTLSRLGITTEMVAHIGDDEAGRFIRNECVHEGVGVTGLISEANALSHVSTVLVDEQSGERSFLYRSPTSSPLSIEDISQETISSAQALFVDNINDVTLQAARWARKAGAWTVLDPSGKYETLKPLLELIDVPIVPERFAEEWMPGQPHEAAAEQLVESGARIAVVTRGERGCVACWEKGTFAFPAFPIEVVDTTGAGDAFHGAFIYGLLQDWPVEEVVRFASAVGTLNCRSLGGRTALPTRSEVDDFINQHQELFAPTPLT